MTLNFWKKLDTQSNIVRNSISSIYYYDNPSLNWVVTFKWMKNAA